MITIKVFVAVEAVFRGHLTFWCWMHYLAQGYGPTTARRSTAPQKKLYSGVVFIFCVLLPHWTKWSCGPQWKRFGDPWSSQWLKTLHHLKSNSHATSHNRDPFYASSCLQSTLTNLISWNLINKKWQYLKSMLGNARQVSSFRDDGWIELHRIRWSLQRT